MVLALFAAALSELVIEAPSFSHDRRFLELLRAHGWLLWALWAAWAGVLALRRRLDPSTTAVVLESRLVYGLTVAALGVTLAAPFTNAYFSHVTHPCLGLFIAWSVWPVVARLWGRGGARLVAIAGRGADLAPWLLALCCALVIFLQSYRRYWWFGAGGKDLGLFHQSVWLLSRFEAPHNTVMGLHAFADHLEFIDVLLAPVMWIWADAGALLLCQALIVAAGAVPIFLLGRRHLGSGIAAAAMVAVYLIGIDLQQAYMFDFNPTTCGAGLLPWVVWAFERERPILFALFLVLVALTKENLVLYGLGLCLTLACGVRRRLPLAAAALLAGFFVLEMKVIFPLFAPEGFRHLRFEAMGGSATEILWSAVKSPAAAFALLWTPGNKINGLLSPFSTMAFAALLAPRYAFALAPVILERFWSSHANRWWGFHYGAGAGVLALLAGIEGLARFRRFAAGRAAYLGDVAVLGVLLAAVLVSSAARFGPGPVWLWRQSYFTTAADRVDAQTVLALIPPEAEVAAQNHLLPHLSGRRHIVEIHRPVTAEYVALDLRQDAWPYGADYVRPLVRDLRQQGYGVIACRGDALLLQRGAASVDCPALAGP
ncbi:MAG: DUF2079 domain-containing protein [Deltaproteobacteria bacterium]|nr:DUF2079 domain-containing protein [Deltaproteobacteria bacterium]